MATEERKGKGRKIKKRRKSKTTTLYSIYRRWRDKGRGEMGEEGRTT